MGNLTVMPAFDYLTVSAGPKTMLYGKTIAVDDKDESITYRGSWSPSSPYPPSFDYASKLYRNTSHWTSKVGDTMEFKFEGNLIFTQLLQLFTLYQAAQWQSLEWLPTIKPP
jgi:hypothetical protein